MKVLSSGALIRCYQCALHNREQTDLQGWMGLVWEGEWGAAGTESGWDWGTEGQD